MIAKFNGSNWGKRLAKHKAVSEMNDFERYQAKIKKAARQKKIKDILAKQ